MREREWKKDENLDDGDSDSGNDENEREKLYIYHTRDQGLKTSSRYRNFNPFLMKIMYHT